MWASFLADLVVLVHFAFVLFVVLGGLLVLYRRGLLWLHLPAALWGFLVELEGWLCPLTHLEVWLRRRTGESGYAEGFVARYLLPVLYPEGLTRDTQLVLAALVVGVNAVVYGGVLWLWRSKKPG